ncbi:MAG: UbiA prenyltransferase family protein [Pseudomonadota bacterium]
MSQEAQLDAARDSGIIALLKLLRPHQWVKNGFVAAPLFFTSDAVNQENIILIILGMVSFCAVSSCVYILNDYADRESDRKHPEKCRRPLAAGTVSVPAAFIALGALLLSSFSLAYYLEPVFAVILATYFSMNLAYSFSLKHVALIDVMIISLGFILRVEGGGALLENVTLSAWIIIMTGLFALFIALAKRRDDVIKELGGDHRRSLDGYTLPFLDTVMSIVTGALLVAYLVYTTDENVMERIGSDKIFYTTPFVV